MRVDYLCAAFQEAMSVLGRPWNALLLTLLQDGPLRFSELADRVPGIGDKILSSRLKQLEAKGIVVRRVDAGPPLRTAYELTPKGRGFRQLASAIERWGRELLGTSGVKPRRAPGIRSSNQRT